MNKAYSKIIKARNLLEAAKAELLEDKDRKTISQLTDEIKTLSWLLNELGVE